MYKTIKVCLYILSLNLVTFTAFATTLSGSLTVDNSYQAFISMDKFTQGVQIGSASDWTITSVIQTQLNAGQDYYLQIAARNIDSVAGFLGEFSLTGYHYFDNGTQQLLTGADWQVSTTGWRDFSAATTFGSNGTAPWYTNSDINTQAEWIWSADNIGDANTFFVAAIRAVSVANTPAVPEPSLIGLYLLALISLVSLTRRQAAR